jgi:6-phosphogluconate dehydrogenase
MSLNEICELGVIGLTSTGQSLAAHHATNKRRVCVCDDDDISFVPQVINEFRSSTEDQDYYEENDDSNNNNIRPSRCMVPSSSVEEFVKIISIPRKIIIFGTHGDDKKFEDIWNKLRVNLTRGDMVLRWGEEESGTSSVANAASMISSGNLLQFYTESIVGNLSKSQAEPQGVDLLEMVKLDQDRATMIRDSDLQDTFVVGGAKDAYQQLNEYISPFASVGHVGSSPQCAHYARMVQRAIEFGMAQCLAEGCDLLKRAALFENQDIGRILSKWQEGGLLTSYLVEISSKIYYKRDGISKKGHVLDHIVDSIDLNGSDTWFSLEATKLGVPAPTINAALEAHLLSNMKEERIQASSILGAPEGADTPSVLKDQIAEDLQGALYSAWICVIAEALSIFVAAADVGQWDINFEECVRLWNLPASFLKSTLLEKIHAALMENQGDIQNLLLLPSIASQLQDTHMSWRRIVTLCFASAVPCSCLGASLTYYDSYRSKKLPSSLIRAQRDFFGGYGYDRFNEDGWYTSCWVQEHTDGLKRAAKASAKTPEKGASDDTTKKKTKKRKTK